MNNRCVILSEDDYVIGERTLEPEYKDGDIYRVSVYEAEQEDAKSFLKRKNNSRRFNGFGI